MQSSTNNNNGHSQNKHTVTSDSTRAVEMLRQKISGLYVDEPNAKEEIVEIAESPKTKSSKHQKFMHELSSSGKSLAQIQTEWHNYYVNLPDNEKHEVWQEFYLSHKTINKSDQQKKHSAEISHINHSAESSSSNVKNKIRQKVRLRSKASRSTHFRSLLFGFSIGGLMIIFLLFGFFNERFIAPFISPSKSITNTPIVIDPASAAVGPESKVIIPKINVELPVIYDQRSLSEKDIQKSLEEGVVHYSSTPNPGEMGNGVIFGHSSNNILNKGKYKFAFVLLKELEIGDTFYLQKDGKRYVYKVGEKKIVKPTDVSILNVQTNQSTFTLITCDPPGTSLNRLLVIGEQISPDPSNNIASTAIKDSQAEPTIIPGNAPSLWQRIKDWITG
ncbi:sortase [Candidatus Saccharibacteria bacterium]|nr:sortase [Candidatus Saccharibacteria bacterium]